MVLGSEGATASAPIEPTGWPSNMGTHTTPASVVFQIPPFTEPKSKVVESPGTPATATTRPPRKGPIKRHLSPFISSGGTGWAIAVTAKNRKKKAKMRWFKHDQNLCKLQTLVWIFSLADEDGVLK